MAKVRLILAFAVTLLVSASLFAQATRTWVSGVGDDVNPCSRTAPCKTFAGAISKTATNGIINVIDPGGFGALTITKAITIDGTGNLASVLGSGTNGIVVNAPTTATVVLRNLDIEGSGGTGAAGTRGVRIIQAGTVVIDHCVISGFAERGVSYEGSQALNLVITDSKIVANRGSGTAGGGVVLNPSGAPTVTATIDHSVVSNVDVAGASGIFAYSGANVTVTDSVVSENSTGVRSAGARISLMRTSVANNGTGLMTSVTANSIIFMSNVALFGNATAGWNISAGTIYTVGNNSVYSNGANTGSLTGATNQ